MATSTEYASFLIRLWREPPAGRKAESVWRGEIVHVQSGERCAVGDLAELIAFLRERCGDANLLAATGRVR